MNTRFGAEIKVPVLIAATPDLLLQNLRVRG